MDDDEQHLEFLRGAISSATFEEGFHSTVVSPIDLRWALEEIDRLRARSFPEKQHVREHVAIVLLGTPLIPDDTPTSELRDLIERIVVPLLQSNAPQ